VDKKKPTAGIAGKSTVKAEDVPEDKVEAVAETIMTKSTTLKISEDGQSVDEFTIFDKN
jgi:hypothetical protein